MLVVWSCSGVVCLPYVLRCVNVGVPLHRLLTINSLRTMKHTFLTREQQQLVAENVEYAQSLALRFSGCGVPLEDLQQESCLGLCEAALRYDQGSNASFRTFAFFWCRKKILLALNEYGMPMRIPQHARDEVQLLDLDITMGQGSDGDDDSTAADRLLYYAYINNVRDDEEEVERFEDKVRASLAVLTKKELCVITHLFGLGGNKSLSRQETAVVLGVSAENVRQLMRRGLGRMMRHIAKFG